MPVRVLTQKQQAFVEFFLSNGGNASDAYRRAYPTAGSGGVVSGPAHKLRNHPLVIEAIAKASAASVAAVDHAVERYAITQERLADLMARLCFTELRQVADVSTEVVDGKVRQVVKVKDFSDIDADAHMALVEVRRSAGGEVSVKLPDKRAAAMDLARLKGWIADKPVDSRQLVMLKIER